MPTDESLHEIRVLLWNQLYTHYRAEEFFDTAWWILLFSLITTYVIWLLLLDKSRLRDILLYGSFVAVIISFIEAVGITMTLWQYNERLLPVVPLPFPFEYTIAPILMMIAFQYTRTWGQYFLAAAIVSGFYALLLLPLAQKLHIIQLYKWNFGYTFILLIGTAVISRYALLAVKNIETSYRHNTQPAPDFLAIHQPTAKPLPDNENEDKDRSNE